MPAPFVIKTKQATTNQTSAIVQPNDVLVVDELEITILEKCTNLEWDSKTGLIYGILVDKNNNLVGDKKLIKYSGTSYGAIPVGGTNTIYWKAYDTTEKCYYRIYTNDKRQKINSDGSLGSMSNLPADKKGYLQIEYNYWYY